LEIWEKPNDTIGKTPKMFVEKEITPRMFDLSPPAKKLSVVHFAEARTARALQPKL